MDRRVCSQTQRFSDVFGIMSICSVRQIYLTILVTITRVIEVGVHDGMGFIRNVLYAHRTITYAYLIGADCLPVAHNPRTLARRHRL